MTGQTVRNAENGVHTPHPIVAERWADATGVPLDWLLTGEAVRDDAPVTVDGGTPERRAKQPKRLTDPYPPTQRRSLVLV